MDIDIPHGFLRAIASGFWFALMTTGVHGGWGIFWFVVGLAGMIFTWTYKMQRPRRIR